MILLCKILCKYCSISKIIGIQVLFKQNFRFLAQLLKILEIEGGLEESRGVMFTLKRRKILSPIGQERCIGISFISNLILLAQLVKILEIR